MATILIIEDDTRAARALAILLERHGHESRCAEDVRTALKELRTTEPDLLLLDLGLPRVDGLELLDAINGEPRMRKLPVIVYSGRDDEETITAAKGLGAVDYVRKGSDWTEIIERIETALSDAAPTAHQQPQQPNLTAGFQTP